MTLAADGCLSTPKLKISPLHMSVNESRYSFGIVPSKIGKYTSSIQLTGAEKPIPLSEWDTAEEAFAEYKVMKKQIY